MPASYDSRSQSGKQNLEKFPPPPKKWTMNTDGFQGEGRKGYFSDHSSLQVRKDVSISLTGRRSHDGP